MKGTLTYIVKRAMDLAVSEGKIKGDLPAPIIEMTRERKFGDYATNIAMVIASKQGSNPRELAGELIQTIRDADTEGDVLDVSVAGPGFINITMSPGFWSRTLKMVLEKGEDFACSDMGAGKQVQVEFVSANPTGPLHVGHGRGAALGDALANILQCAGYKVQREYYINDAGNQIQTLGISVYARYLELLGRETVFPEEGYKGDYIREIAERLVKEYGELYLNMSEDKAVEEIAVKSAPLILDDIRQDLEEFGVVFDRWFSETDLLERGDVQKTLKDMEKRGTTFMHEGALWFRSTDKGDDKDRVLIKSDGSLTYFASDVAYHRDKYERGFGTVINIWGADHHGYVARMKASIQGLGRDPDDLQIVLVQLVSLVRKGKPVAMSTRAGEFVTLREVRNEVGRDAARFIFLTRKSDSKLDFDLDLAKEKSNDNPVYYVQYAHARICSILRNAQEQGVSFPEPGGVDLTLLDLPEEKELIRHVAALPDVVEGAAISMEPHRITTYLRDIATTLHSYYYHHRVLTDDVLVTEARLAMVLGVRTAIAKALALLGVSAPERM
ncbi:MAG: arginine--tRNA ligase [bacterium]|nr:arginine--tRNA ligase [bacterium]MDT8365347.1 arginine--tRNA ligase [bacterium]